ncbi:MAG: glycerol kinase GlpK [Saprospiraceae bacterium]|nr:glycerol kinase GlpK [Saprospiraceae bacterium]
MNKKYVLALDQGTTSSRAILFDAKSNIIGISQKEFKQIYPKAGWVEHDPEEIWMTQCEVIEQVIKNNGIAIDDIASVGITNQRETIVVWDKVTGKPVYNAIVWQDNRTSDTCKQIYIEGKHEWIRAKTGLIVDSYFSSTKIKWILENIEGVNENSIKGNLLLGTIDSWLIWKLTDGERHVTDVSNASRTMLYNINTNEWDEELLQYFNIPKCMLPKVVASSEIIGNVTSGITKGIPISGVCGDQQSALFGQMCIYEGMVKNTYGTGCFMMLNTGEKLIQSDNKLLTTIAWKINNKITYALEGSIFIGGAVVKWLRDSLKIINESSEIGELALQVSENDGIYFVPAFTGLGAPYWEQDAKGTLLGMTLSAGRPHVARAALESIAYQTLDVLLAMEKDAKISIKELRVDGGASVSDVLMQFQSDILKTNVVRPKITETTALGAAYLAGLAVNFWKNIEEIEQLWQVDKKFSPKMNDERVKAKIQGWRNAIDTTLYHAKKGI